MIKKNLPTLIITSIVILLPVFAGLLLWDKLPAQIATHWNVDGIADGFSSKAMTVFALPAFILVIHWLCMIFTSVDPKNKDIGAKPLVLVLWICPVISVLVSTVTYSTALGYAIDIIGIISLVSGAMFVVIGNYMPKCSQNYTIGIKVPWTLNDLQNWNKTHRFAGILWTIGGIIIMITSFVGSAFVMLPIIIVMAILPMLYSYCYYRKNNNK